GQPKIVFLKELQVAFWGRKSVFGDFCQPDAPKPLILLDFGVAQGCVFRVSRAKRNHFGGILLRLCYHFAQKRNQKATRMQPKRNPLRTA
ncbi:hypothetical protein, partial [Rhodobacter sp. TJ_12]|uniref:hypothetical protein n=1 Tax=Rhodobacter sp. TJ_12 TaxID=2029399 RepID=UPI001CBD900B